MKIFKFVSTTPRSLFDPKFKLRKPCLSDKEISFIFLAKFQILIKTLPDFSGGTLDKKLSMDSGFDSWSGEIPHAAEQLNTCAPQLWSHMLQKPQSLCCTIREANAKRRLMSTMKSSPTRHNQRKPAQGNEDLVQPKTNK